MSLAASRGDASYDLVLLLHVLAAIVGFGAVFLNGIYGAQAKARRGTDGLAIAQANYLVSNVGTYFIYAVFVTGLVLVLMHEGWGFGDTWIWLSIVLYLVGLGLSHGVMRPNVTRLIALMAEMAGAGPPAGAEGPPPQLTEMEERGKRVGATGATLNVLLVVILYLMIFKPGA